ncbi:unnamed protein product [Sympodiomycopsis kandeliae]
MILLSSICLSVVVLVVFVSLVAWRVLKAHVLHIGPYQHLPAAKLATWDRRWPLFGESWLIRESEPAEANMQWSTELKSNVYVYRGFLYSEYVYLGDSKGISHILAHSHSYNYAKPKRLRNLVEAIVGKGLITVDGEVHRRQRKLCGKAFSNSAVRAFTPTFFEHANGLTCILQNLVEQTNGPEERPFMPGQSSYGAKASGKGKPVFDLGFWISKVTLDIIGECGFGHRFRSVETASGGMQDSFAADLGRLMAQGGIIQPIDVVRDRAKSTRIFSWLRYFPNRREQRLQEIRRTVNTQSLGLVARKKADIARELQAIGATKANLTRADLDDTLQISSSSKDFLHLLIRANMASDVEEPDRLDDEDLLAQVTTFLFAGHETSSQQALWGLNALAARPDVVQRIRMESEDVFVGRDKIGLDELNRLPYLDRVVKEVMRRHPAIDITYRTATKDEIIPLGESYPTRDGKGHFNSIAIKAGTDIAIPTLAVNRSQSLWGPTADDFDPDRWLPENMPENAQNCGLPMHLATFLLGPRGCIGNRFAIAELKVLLVVLLRNFDFERVDGWQIRPQSQIVVKTLIKGQEEVGIQMPLRVSRVRTAKPASACGG